MRAALTTHDVPVTKPATELLAGELVQKLSPLIPHSRVQVAVIFRLSKWVEENNPRGDVLSEIDADVQAGEHVDRFVPDIGYISDRTTIVETRSQAVRSPFTVAFEIASPDDRWRPRVAYKLAHYLAAGTDVVAIEPLLRSITICEPSGSVRELRLATDVFSLDSIPGFTFSLGDFFSVLDR